MTHNVCSELYLPDNNYFVPVGSSGRQFSQRASTAYRNSSDIPHGRWAALAPPLLPPPPACQTREGKRVGSKQRDFPVAQGVKSRSGKGKRNGCPHRVQIQGRRLIFILSTFCPALGEKESNESCSSALLTCWSPAAADCNHLLMRLNSAWTLSPSLSLYLFFSPLFIFYRYLFLSLIAFVCFSFSRPFSFFIYCFLSLS